MLIKNDFLFRVYMEHNDVEKEHVAHEKSNFYWRWSALAIPHLIFEENSK